MWTLIAYFIIIAAPLGVVGMVVFLIKNKHKMGPPRSGNAAGKARDTGLVVVLTIIVLVTLWAWFGPGVGG